ncbi:hypothetical protein L7F22_046313 [Adiantum nelumboides]|nr:hypothetical protein [Adiantum nelumboides]
MEPRELTTNRYDRKGNYYMTLHGVVDVTMRLRDIYVGFLGPANDKLVLQNSSFFCLAQASLVAYPISSSTYTFAGKIQHSTLFDKGYCGAGFWPAKDNMAISFLHGTVRQPDTNKLPKVIATRCILHDMGIDHVLQVRSEAKYAALQAYHQEDGTSYDEIDDINMENVAMYLDERHRTAYG